MKSAEKMACSFDTAASINFLSLTWAILWGVLPRGDFKKNLPDLICSKYPGLLL
jgi:hypothetical protein